MTNRLADILETVSATGTLSEALRRQIQRVVYDDGRVSLEEADTLFAINDGVHVGECPEWTNVFIGAITDLVVRQTAPANHVDASEGVWLMQRITADGKVKGGTEMALLLNILRYAESAPDMLEHFALDTVRDQVTSNGFVTAEDVEQLRSVLYACGSSGGVGISRMEAECLFDIADATEGATNDASFEDLFVGAVANHLMMSGAPAKLSTEEAMRREYWLHERGSITAAWRRAITNIARTIAQGFAISRDADTTTQTTRQSWLDVNALIEAEAITGGESRWLVDRLDRDGQLSSCERALMAFLETESPSIHASLTDRIRAAA